MHDQRLMRGCEAYISDFVGIFHMVVMRTRICSDEH